MNVKPNKNRLIRFAARSRPHGVWYLAVLVMSCSLTFAATNSPQPAIEPSPLVEQLLHSPTLDETQRRALALFHGRWDQLEQPTTQERAAMDLARFDLNAVSLTLSTTPPIMRARAALLRGEPLVTVKLLEQAAQPEAQLLVARAWTELGRQDLAVTALAPLVELARSGRMDDAAALTAAAQALVLNADLRGRPSDDFQLAMQLLGQAHQQVDRLYWPAPLAEAGILLEKDNPEQAIQAVMQALALNPQSGWGWYRLGEIHLRGYDFDKVGLCLEKLRAINPTHPLADILETRLLLTQKDGFGADHIVRQALARYPTQRTLLSLQAAAEALKYDTAAMRKTLDRFDELAEGSPAALYEVGRYLSGARQYPDSQVMLEQAIARAPNWPAPHIELGLMLMQSGDEPEAHRELQRAVALDPFNRRARNQLKLVEELLGYQRIETEHFIIKFHPGVDEVLARDMPEALEKIYDDVTAMFSHEPTRPTLIEIMPDEQWFSVRITGMPWIWTIGASTGDVIAITPPREGARQRGAFNWETVIRHEFAHTVTLDQTNNRVPHWFTEACAVATETNPRPYDMALMLAAALYRDELFDLEDINWAFVRPKRENDRSLAYAQAHWMYEYLERTYGHQVIINLLEAYRQGTPNVQAMAQVTGIPAEQFLSEFRAWATRQVEGWGLSPREGDLAVQKALAGGGHPSAEVVTKLLETYPAHPALLKEAARLAMAQTPRDPAAARRAVQAYHRARPIDPWSHRALLKLALDENNIPPAIEQLRVLNQLDAHQGAWAAELAQYLRQTGDLDDAGDAMQEAIYREPYRASWREQAATILLQNGRMRKALSQVQALTLLEPDRELHWLRLAALQQRLGDAAGARQAALKAKELNPDAPVQAFLQDGR